MGKPINSNYNYSYKNIRENIEEIEGKLGSTVYKHHFNFVITAAQSGLSEDATVFFNCISNNKTPYAKFGDLDGDGFIASAFGEVGYWIIDARLLYQGNLLVYASNVSTGEVRVKIIHDVGDTVVFDSVTKI